MPKRTREQFKDELAAIVVEGGALYRAELLLRLHREGVAKGRTNSLLAAARHHLGWDRVASGDTVEQRFLRLMDSANVSLTRMLEKLEARTE